MRQICAIGALAMTAIIAAAGGLPARADPLISANVTVPPVSGQTIADTGGVRTLSIASQHNGGTGDLTLPQSAGTGAYDRRLETASVDLTGVTIEAEADAASSGNMTTATDATRAAAITDSFNGYDGAVIVQQDTGSASALAAATAVGGGPLTGPLAAGAQVTAAVEDNATASSGGTRSNGISQSWNDDARGVVTVQQNNGDASVLGAATAVLLDAAGTAPTHATLSSNAQATLTGNSAVVSGGSSQNRVEAAFNGFAGIATIQQNNGVNALLSAATAAAPGAGAPTLSTAALGAVVSGNTSMVSNLALTSGSYSNIITNAFNGARGVITVQQNNGANSVLQSAITVSARY